MSRDVNVKISIVIAVYNMEKTVERAIRSVLNQTYENKELIVMDGGSTDGTVSIITKYAEKLKYWVSAPDQGPSDAISKALSHAEGTLIGFLGADDWYEPYALELVAEASKNGDADLFYGNIAVHNGDEVQVKDLSSFCPDRLYTDGTQWLGAVCAFTKKELLAWNYTKENNVLHTDYLYFLRLFAENKRFAHIGSDRVITNFSIGGRTTRGDFCSRLNTHREVTKLRAQFKREYPEMRDLYSKHDEIAEKEFAIGMMPYYRRVLGVEDYRANIMETDLTGDCCILFGAGNYGVQIAKEWKISETVRIECFVDNDPKKWGQYVEGIEVKSPETLLNMEGKCVIVTPAPKYETQIMEQLRRWGVDQKNQVVSYANIAVQIYNRLGIQVLEEAYHRGVVI